MPAPNADAKINLSRLTFLAIDDNSLSLQLVCQMLLGFGVGDMIKCLSAAEAMKVIERRPIDLVITDGQMPDMDGYAFTRWVRRLEHAENRYVPILMLSGETRLSHIGKGRDVGASVVIAKPVRPQTLLDRLLWISRDEREFIESEGYSGPDRRFRIDGLDEGAPDRRQPQAPADSTAQAGAEVDPQAAARLAI